MSPRTIRPRNCLHLTTHFCQRDLRYAARALEEKSAADDAFFAQFEETVQADESELLKIIQTRQQDACVFAQSQRTFAAHLPYPRC